MSKKLFSWILRLFILFSAVYLFGALLLGCAGMIEESSPVDAMVVFGNKVERSGEPSLSLASRLDKAVTLYHQRRAAWVIVSGAVGKEGWDEAQVMADYLAARGIPREVILVDSGGKNTYLTALNSAALAEAYDLDSFLLVSHFYHLPRARLMFQKLGMTRVSIAHSERFVARDFYYGLMREVIAFPIYFFRY